MRDFEHLRETKDLAARSALPLPRIRRISAIAGTPTFLEHTLGTPFYIHTSSPRSSLNFTATPGQLSRRMILASCERSRRC
jgi:hypothetical protein